MKGSEPIVRESFLIELRLPAVTTACGLSPHLHNRGFDEHTSCSSAERLLNGIRILTNKGDNTAEDWSERSEIPSSSHTISDEVFSNVFICILPLLPDTMSGHIMQAIS